VQELDLESTPKRAKIGDSWVEAMTVLVCSGVSYRKMGLPDEDKFLGKGISHCALCDGNFFRNQVVGVVGGGNSALEESLYLSKIVSKLHLVHRRNAFTAIPVYQDKVRNIENIALEMESTVSSLHGNDFLEGVTLKRLATGKEDYIPLSGLFVFIGFVPQGDFLPSGLNRDSQGFLVTDTEMRTNIPGVFAAGDIRSKLCRQVVTAVGDGATAANAAFTYLEQQHG
jgi:thioredoxin reductase (NADPH)